MNQSTNISRRGALQAALAVLAALFGVSEVRAAAGEHDARPRDGQASDPRVYREFDKYGRVVVEIGPAPRWTEIRTYAY